jgi:polyisoprenoid-binding protein YceI
MRRLWIVSLLWACGPDLDELAEDVDVEVLAFDDDPADEGPPPNAVWELDPDRDPVLGFTAWGMFDLEQVGVWSRYNVRIAERGEGPVSYDIRFTADNDSIETGIGQLDDHIRTDDFLDVPNHETATFSSTGLTSGDDGWSVGGDMTLRGTTKPITFTADIEPGDAIHTTATIEFSRWDFGLYAADVDEPGGDNAQDRVVVTYDVWLKRVD